MHYSYDAKDFSQRCRELRLEKEQRLGTGFSQKEVAKAIGWGTTPSSLNRFENGNGNIPIDKLKKLACKLDVSVQYLLFGVDPLKNRVCSFNTALPQDFQGAQERLGVSLTSSCGEGAYDDIGRRVKWIRKEKGFTQQQLAEKLGYADRSTINKIEKGGRKLQIENLVTYVKLFDIPADYFVSGLPYGATHYKDTLRKFHYIDQIKLIEATIQQMERRNKKP